MAYAGFTFSKVFDPSQWPKFIAALTAGFKAVETDLSAVSVLSPGFAKAWVNFDGTTSAPTIRSSYNIASVTKNGTGDYTITFKTAFADANYCPVWSGTTSGSLNNSWQNTPNLKTLSAASLRINFVGDAPNGTAVDQAYVCVAFFHA